MGGNPNEEHDEMHAKGTSEGHLVHRSLSFSPPAELTLPTSFLTDTHWIFFLVISAVCSTTFPGNFLGMISILPLDCFSSV